MAVGGTLPARTLITILRSEKARRGAEDEGEEEDWCFHGVVWLLWFGRAHRPHRVDAENNSVRARRESILLKPGTPFASPASALVALRKQFIRIFMGEP